MSLDDVRVIQRDKVMMKSGDEQAGLRQRNQLSKGLKVLRSSGANMSARRRRAVYLGNPRTELGLSLPRATA